MWAFKSVKEFQKKSNFSKHRAKPKISKESCWCAKTLCIWRNLRPTHSSAILFRELSPILLKLSWTQQSFRKMAKWVPKLSIQAKFLEPSSQKSSLYHNLKIKSVLELFKELWGGNGHFLSWKLKICKFCGKISQIWDEWSILENFQILTRI